MIPANTMDSQVAARFLISGTIDPTVTPTHGLKGLFYIRYVTNGITVAGVYQKQDDGLSTNWSQIADSASLSISGANLGSGTPIYDSMTNPASLSYVMNFKTLVAGTNVTFDTTVPGEIKINAAGGGGGGSTGANLGVGLGVYKNNSGSVLNFKTLVASGVVTLSNPDADTINIDVPESANRTLSNLSAPTSINQKLLPSATNSIEMGDYSAYWQYIYAGGYRAVADAADVKSDFAIVEQTQGMVLRMEIDTSHGANSPSGVPMYHSIMSDPGSNYGTNLFIYSPSTGGPFNPNPTGGINVETGNAHNIGNSGSILLRTGTVATGTRGSIQFKNGSEGTIGHVWMSTDVSGSGSWTAAPYLPLTGGTLTGNLVMSGFAITNVLNPVNPQDAATKNYVDGTFANKNLSNLTAVAVNTDIKPALAFGADSGTATLPWSNVNASSVSAKNVKVYRNDSSDYISGTLGVNNYYSAIDVDLPGNVVALLQTPYIPVVAKIITVVTDSYAIYSVNDSGVASDNTTKPIYLMTGNKDNGASTNVPVTGSMRFSTGSIVTGTTGTTGSIIISTGVKIAGNSSTGGSGSVALVSGNIGVNPASSTILNPTTSSGVVAVQSGANFINTASRNNTGGLSVRSGSIGAATGGPFINGGTTGGISLSSGDHFGTIAVGTAAQNITGAVTMTTGNSTITSFGIADIATGSAFVFSGNSASGKTGSVTVRSGVATNGTSGAAFIFSGTSTNSLASGSGSMNIGSGANSGTGGTGIVTITSGGAASAFTTGSHTFRSGANTGSGPSGDAFIGSGDVVTGASGHIDFNTGNANGSGTTGYINMTTGVIASGSGSTGQIAIVTGPISGPPLSWTGNSGGIFVASGGVGSGISGQADFRSGDSDSGGTGTVSIHSGNNGSGAASGDVQIYSGSAAGGTSGNISLTTAALATTRGEVLVSARQMNMQSTPIVNLPTPTLSHEAANKAYVDSVAANQKIAVMRDQLTQGTAGATMTAPTWNSRNLNTLEDPFSVIQNPGVFVGTGGANTTFDLAAGTYHIKASMDTICFGSTTSRLYNVTDAVTTIWGLNSSSATTTPVVNVVEGIFTISGAKTFHIETYTDFTSACGNALNLAGRPEVYGSVTITKMS